MTSQADDDGADYKNPFTLPADEEIFRMRDEEHARKQAERGRLHIYIYTSEASLPFGHCAIRKIAHTAYRQDPHWAALGVWFGPRGPGFMSQIV